MHFTITQQELHRGLALVGRAVTANPSHPIEAYVLAQVSAEEQCVRLSAHSEDMGIQCWIRASQIDESGTTLLPARMLSDFVSNLPSSSLVVTSPAETDPTSCHFQCAHISAHMKNTAHDPAEFPPLPAHDVGTTPLLYLDGELLKQVIAQVSFAAAKHDTHPRGLTGIFLAIEDGRATFAAADSYRLAARHLPIPNAHLRQRLLLPARALEELAKLLPQEGSVHVLLTHEQNQVLFHTSQVDVSVRLLNVSFPDIEHGAIPAAWTTRAILPTQELASLVRLMTPFARQGRNFIGVRLFEASNSVTLEAVAPDFGRNQNEVVNVAMSGPDQEIDLHVKYISDVLEIISTPQVALEVTDRQRPVVIKPVGGEDYSYVIMPVNFDQNTVTAPRGEAFAAHAR